MVQLNLDELAKGDVAEIPPFLGRFLAEAAAICLESQGHNSGVDLEIDSLNDNAYVISWNQVNESNLRFWNDAQKTTEFGAICIALILAKHETTYSVIESSRQGTGFDYWLGDRSDVTIQRKARLEVSGIRRGSQTTLRARMRQKREQVARYASDYPGTQAFVIVVEFGTPRAEVDQL